MIPNASPANEVPLSGVTALVEPPVEPGPPTTPGFVWPFAFTTTPPTLPPNTDLIAAAINWFRNLPELVALIPGGIVTSYSATDQELPFVLVEVDGHGIPPSRNDISRRLSFYVYADDDEQAYDLGAFLVRQIEGGNHREPFRIDPNWVESTNYQTDEDFKVVTLKTREGDIRIYRLQYQFFFTDPTIE